jgi:hypothetical protein
MAVPQQKQKSFFQAEARGITPLFPFEHRHMTGMGVLILAALCKISSLFFIVVRFCTIFLLTRVGGVPFDFSFASIARKIATCPGSNSFSA